ncbi:MAG TPA: aryl-sulfate sulfotransferase [bacterium]|nr:aryl-sulfate sulfotransferase [bacterium]
MKTATVLTLGLLLFEIGLVSAQPEPWVHPDGSIHYYNAVAAPAGINWAAASDSAQRPGGYLATITSQAENDFVYGLVDSGIYWHQRSGKWAGPWLGGKQRLGAPEPDSGWQWIDGEPFSYSNWSPGEPDNQGDENAINFGESASGRIPTWNDLSDADTAVHGYVVELSADSTTIGLLQNDTNASVGYNLFESNRARFIYLVDNKGRYIHSWYSTYPPGLSNYLLEDGSLLHTAMIGNTHFTPGGSGGRVERYDWDGNRTWFYNYSSSNYCQHHDVEPLPNGHVLLVAWELKTRAEAIAAGRDTTKLTDNELWPDHVVEVDTANDSIVWEWHVWDHVIQDYDSTKSNYGVVANHSELVDLNYIRNGNTGADWIHTNAVDYNPQFDQILLSAHDFGEVWVIDHSTTTAQAKGHTGGRYGMGGDLLYRWGNPQAYRAGGTSNRKFYGQHDSKWIVTGLPGAGHIMVYNNGPGRPGGQYSTVDEFVPDCDSTGHYNRPAPGSPFGPSAQSWIYAATPPASFFSASISGAERLPNGNTLICEGNSGYFFEVTRDSQVIWRYLNPQTDSLRLYQGDTVPSGVSDKQNATFRVTRYAPDYAGLVGKNLTPGYPLERYRSPVLGLAEVARQPVRPGIALSVQPNPARVGSAISLQLTANGSEQVSVFDASGRLIRSLPQSRISNLASKMIWDGRDASGRLCPPGVYVCRLSATGGAATRKLVLAN